MEGGGFFLIGGYLDRCAVHLWDFQCGYMLASAVTWWVGDVAICRPYVRALCCFIFIFIYLFLYQFSDLEAEPMVVVWRSIT